MKPCPIFLALACCALAARSDQPLESYLPDSSLAVLSIDDMPGLFEQMETGALAKSLQGSQGDFYDEALAKPLTLADGESLELSDGHSLTMARLPQLLSGRFSASILSRPAAGSEGLEFEAVLIADFAGDHDDLRFLQALDRGSQSDEIIFLEENYAGETLIIEELDTPDDPDSSAEFWALVDGMAIEATSLELLKNAVDAILDGGAKSSLIDSPTYQDALDVGGPNQVRFFMNLDRAESELRRHFGEHIGELPVNPLGVTFDSLWASLALDALDSFIATIDFQRSVGIDITIGMLYDTRSGLLGLINYSGQPLVYPSWIPADAIDSTVSNLDFGAAWSSFEAMMNEMSPNFGALLQLQLDNFREQTGIDLRESLFNNLGSEFISFSVSGSSNGQGGLQSLSAVDAEPLIVAIPVRDPVAFEQAIKGLAELLAPGQAVLVREPFFDYEIVTIANYPAENPPFGYALADGYLVLALGSVDLLERTLFRLGESEQGLWDQRAIQEGLNLLPPGPVASSYLDLQPIADQTLAAFQNQFRPGTLEIFGIPMPKPPRDFSLPFFVLASSYVTRGAQVTRAKILPQPTEQ